MKYRYMNRFKNKSLKGIEKVAFKTTHFIGSTNSLIIHTILFIGSFVFYFFGIPFEQILLVVTTIVSLEAIYLSIFIQMSVNHHAHELESVAEDLEEIQEDVEGIEKDIDEIQEDIEEDEEEEKEDDEMMERIENTLGKLIEEVMELKRQHQDIMNKK